ncbi:MerR family transcriptional regulator [Nonomuraea roseoviolacea]|uniref:DNA-binding transcriptional MerR regulator n=1 Tax=Nonomuraea roseoviolacea subsp. carminata TaxID=160689 RepID=A0ABT1K9F1_9ACTN|nr:MerR family transcriptional regulator [Nonomuraea roseoviolacea]MCP2350654.1 DNA-binding transcriptional MerR regulator [Nonomuraea roseoviolacea subsp. carminata]
MTLTLQEVLDRGLTPRTLNYWIDRGLLRPSTWGHGIRRDWPQTELQVADLMRRLVAAGLTADVAALVARAHLGGRPLIKLAPGIVIAIDTDLLQETT